MLCMEFFYIWIIGLREEEFTCIYLYKPMWGYFWADLIFMRKLYKPCPMDAVCQISEY